jgi:hypothetical protein
MIGEPMGFGLRNYWAGAIKDILHQIDFFEYPVWKNKYYYHDLYGAFTPLKRNYQTTNFKTIQPL